MKPEQLTDRQKAKILRKAASYIDNDNGTHQSGMCGLIDDAAESLSLAFDDNGTFRDLQLKDFGITKKKYQVRKLRYEDNNSYWYFPRMHMLLRKKHLIDAAKVIEKSYVKKAKAKKKKLSQGFIQKTSKSKR